MRSHWAGLPVAVCAVWLFGLAELAAVSALKWSTLAGIWELTWGSIWLAPGALITGAAGAALVFGVWRALRSERIGWRAAGLCCVALVASAVGLGLTQGRHFDIWWRRAGFILLLTAVGAGGAYRFSRRIDAWDSRPRAVLAGLSVAIVGLELANALVLVRLYPVFHWALTGLTLSLCVVAADLVRPGAQRLLGAAVAAVCLLSSVAAPLASGRLARFDNYRLLLQEHAPFLGRAVELIAIFAPPPELAPVDSPIQDRRPSSTLSFQDRDILLISVDALRADHLGAYGYARKTTPHMDALAKSGVRFERAYCATPHTSYSITSMMTGKFIRPLLLQGAGGDSETWAQALQRYEYRTAAFYPPAVFFIDPARFAPFEKAKLGFEYEKKEFLEGEPRVQQVREYLTGQPPSQKLFIWVHLFGPHEPYESHPEHPFGESDLDRYDSEVAAADRTVGRLVEMFRRRSPKGVVILTSDHGEEFGEHGGWYHGSSVYEEQVRVPMIFNAPGAIRPGVVPIPVQTIDLLPTVLAALSVPAQPRIRGRDLGPLLGGQSTSGDRGFAYAETEEQSMLAEANFRLICARRLGACRLFDIRSDPGQKTDLAGEEPELFSRMKQHIQSLNASHGRFEERGLRREGKGWPAPILRALTGDGDAAPELATLLDDADAAVRQQAARLLFELPRKETAAALRLALARDEDEVVRRFAALALTRLGEGAALATELLSAEDVAFRRLAALALAEQGDRRGHMELVAWWQNRPTDLEFARATQILAALGRARSKQAVWPLLQSLDDVRLRPAIAKALGAIGDDAARGPLAKALAKERYQGTRAILAETLSRLGASTELVVPLRRWLGVPDPLKNGLRIATEAGILQYIGGPDPTDLKRARSNAAFGEVVRVIVPRGGNGRGLRLIVRARNKSDQRRLLRVGLPHRVFAYDSKGKLTKSRKVPEIHPVSRLELGFPAGRQAVEVATPVPTTFELRTGRASHLVVLAERGLEFESIAVLPLQDEPVGPKPESDSKKLTIPAPLDATAAPKQ